LSLLLIKQLELPISVSMYEGQI